MRFIEKDALLLFLGDSITVAGRSREDLIDLGLGYPALVAALFSARCP